MKTSRSTDVRGSNNDRPFVLYLEQSFLCSSNARKIPTMAIASIDVVTSHQMRLPSPCAACRLHHDHKYHPPLWPVSDDALRCVLPCCLHFLGVALAAVESSCFMLHAHQAKRYLGTIQEYKLEETWMQVWATLLLVW